MPNPYAAELAQGLALQQAGKFAAAEGGYGRIDATVGNLVEKIDRLSRKTQYVYDDLHRRIEENWLDGGDATIRPFAHTYDALGRLTALDETIDSSPGTNYAYAYDGLGRLTSETQSLISLAIDITYESTFDANGRRTKLLSELGAYNDFDNRYYYDNLGRLTSVDQRQRTSGTSTVIAPKRFDFAYNAASQLSQVTRYADLSGFEFVANQFNQYDGLGRLTRLLHTTDGTAPGSGWGSGALAGYDNAYDAATRLTEIDSFVDGLTEYTHDNTSQLTAADHTGQTDENYAYDENGNRTGGGYVTGDNNQTTEDGVYTYTYDAEGNRLTRTRVSDGYVTAYEWDHRNRLVSVTELDDLEAVLSETTHDYDAFNQWIRRTVDSVETIFAHHDGQIVYQFNGDSAADLTNRYLWNPATIDQLLVDEVVANLSTAGDLQFPMGDHLGTIRDIAAHNASTDTTTIANHIRYNSFGKVVSETNSSIDLLFGFTSRPFDSSTSLQNNLHRWYDAALGQWASEDPIGFAAGDANIRRYVANQSTNQTDPSGLQPPTLTDLLIDAARKQEESRTQQQSSTDEIVNALGDFRSKNPHLHLPATNYQGRTTAIERHGQLSISVIPLVPDESRFGNYWSSFTSEHQIWCKGSLKKPLPDDNINKQFWDHLDGQLDDLDRKFGKGNYEFRTLVIDGHGSTAVVSNFLVLQELQNPKSRASSFLQRLNDILAFDAQIDLRVCNSAHESDGKQFLILIAKYTGAKTYGSTGTYAVDHSGETWSATPSGTLKKESEKPDASGTWWYQLGDKTF